jgi:hypothetical protein
VRMASGGDCGLGLVGEVVVEEFVAAVVVCLVGEEEFGAALMGEVGRSATRARALGFMVG